MAVLVVLPSFAQSPKLKPLKAQDLQGTLLPLEKKGEWGYADERGKFVIKHIFSEARPFQKGIAIVRCGEKYGLLDRTGVFLLEPTYDEMKDFRGMYSIVRLNGKYGTIGRDGRPITEPRFDAYDSRKGLKAILVTLNGSIGALDERGKLIVEPHYARIGEVEDGIAFVEKDGLIGAVNASMRQVVEPVYDSLAYTGTGVLYAEKDGLKGVISYRGEEKIPLKYDDVQLAKYKRYYITTKNGKYGVVTNAYKEILSPVLRVIPELKSSNILIKQDSILFLASERDVCQWVPERDFDLRNLDSLPIPESPHFNKTPFGNNMTIIHIDSIPYFMTEGEKVVWAANPAIKKWAEQPLNYQMEYENVTKKGYMTAVNQEKKRVQIEHSFDLQWPVAAIDPRVDVEQFQRALLAEMAKKVYGERVEQSFSTIDDFLTYATTHPRHAEQLTNVRSSVTRTKVQNMGAGGYSLTYVGRFIGDETQDEVTYDFHMDMQEEGTDRVRSRPQFLHVSRSTGLAFTLNERYSLSAQSKMVSMIKSGNVVLGTDEERRAFEVVREDCADVDENFYVKDGLTYFYKRPFSSIPPLHIGVRQLGDITLRRDGGQR